MVDYTGLIGLAECPLCPPGLGEAYPPIAQYHWSKLPNPNLQTPKYGGRFSADLRYDPTNWDPFTGNVGTYVWGNLPYSRLVTHDITLYTAFNTGGANMYPLLTVCDVCESWKITGANEYTLPVYGGWPARR